MPPGSPSRQVYHEYCTESLCCFFRGYETQAPDREGILLKKGTLNIINQHRWFSLWVNLFYLEHQADRNPLSLMLLENCQVESRLGATEPYAFTILTPGLEGTTGGQVLQADSRKPGRARSLAVGTGWGELEAAGFTATLPGGPVPGAVPGSWARAQLTSRGLWLPKHPQLPLQLPGVA